MDSSSPSPVVDALPPIPPSRRPMGPLTFLQPEDDLEEMTPSPSPSLEEESSEEGLSPSGSGSPSDESAEDAASAPRSSRGSSGNALGKAALKAATIKGVLIGSEMAHRVAARTEGQRAVGLLRADEDDAENIGDPLSELIHRRGGIAGAAAAANPDVGDAIRMMMGLANFGAKQIAAAMQARDIDEQLAAGVRQAAADVQ